MNRLPENKHFVANVHGTLCARFRLDTDRIHTEVDPDGTTFYQIDLLFAPQKPAARTIEDVTFYLDDTYIESLRLAQKLRDGTYQATIGSYGDFVITVEVTIDGRRFLQQMWLADMLEAGYADSIPSPEILRAIKEIRAN